MTMSSSDDSIQQQQQVFPTNIWFLQSNELSEGRSPEKLLESVEMDQAGKDGILGGQTCCQIIHLHSQGGLAVQVRGSIPGNAVVKQIKSWRLSDE
jgi:hypothetical protein